MKKKIVIAILAVISIALIAAILAQPRQFRTKDQQASVFQKPLAPPTSHSENTAQKEARVPAHFENAQSIGKLQPTLAPESFFGKSRQAYQAAKEIPETLAQLPCYCYCDESLGHKSLHTCYETDHASHCEACTNEALTAYRLQKEEKLNPAQIRARIITEYASRH